MDLPYVTTDAAGDLVLVDPAAAGMIRAAGEHNCRIRLEQQAERVRYFAQRLQDRGDDPAQIAIVLINVDDVHGRDIADQLMPGQDAMWQRFREQGQTPFARGLAGREGIFRCVECLNPEQAIKMQALPGIVVVVIDHGTAAVFGIDEVPEVPTTGVL